MIICICVHFFPRIPSEGLHFQEGQPDRKNHNVDTRTAVTFYSDDTKFRRLLDFVCLDPFYIK